MDKNKNPYSKFIVDECSGIQVSNIKYEIWAEGYNSGRKNTRAILTEKPKTDFAYHARV